MAAPFEACGLSPQDAWSPSGCSLRSPVPFPAFLPAFAVLPPLHSPLSPSPFSRSDGLDASSVCLEGMLMA